MSRAGRAVATAALATALATVAATPGGPAGAAPGRAAAQAVLLTLLDRTAWVGDGFDFELTVQATAAPPGSQLRMSVHDEVRSRSEFDRSLVGLGLRRELFPLPPVGIDQADSDGDGTITLGVPLVARDGVEPVDIDDPGTYPVEVELLDADDEVLATLYTHLVRLPAAGAEPDAVPLAVAVVVPVHAPPADLDARDAGPTEAPVLDQLDAVTAALTAHPEIPVNLMVTPESVNDAAAVEPDLVEDLTSAVAANGSEVLSMPWVQLDDAGWATADDGTLTRQLARGDQAVAALLGVEPSGTRVVRSGRTAPTAVAMVNHGAGLLVVDEADLEPLDTTEFPYTVARPFTLALDDDPAADAPPTIPALGADAGLAELAGTVTTDPILAANQLLAALAVIGADEPESARVATLVLPPDAVGSAPFLDALLSGLEPPPAPFAPEPAALPLVVPSTVGDAVVDVEPVLEGDGDGSGDPVVRRFAGTEETEDVGNIARRLAEEEADLASYRTIFGPDDPIAQRVEVVLATSAGDELDAGERGAAVASTRSARDEILGGISGPEQQRVRLTDREGQIQLVLTNASGVPADIHLVLRGDRLVFPDAPDGVMPVRLDETSTRVDVRVEARSSGDAPLEVRLTSPDGRLLLAESRITVRATAISGVGIALMSAAVVFLALWWSRTIRRERRARRRGHPAHLRHT